MPGKEAKEGYYCDTCKYQEGNYVDNKKDGIWTKYYTNTWIKRAEVTYENDLPNGPYTLYYKDGRVMERGMLQDGDNFGELKKFWANDTVRQLKTFNSNGEVDGYMYDYFPNGQIKRISKFNNGIQIDTMIEYASAGMIYRWSVYDSLGNDIENKRYKTDVFPHIGMMNKKPCLEKPLADSLEEVPVSIVRYGRLHADGVFEGRCLRFGRYYLYNGDGTLKSIQFWGGGKFIRDELDD